MFFQSLWQSKKTAKEKDQVWMDGFSQGFSKAWDMMMPIMLNGIEKVKDQIRNKAFDDAVKNVEPALLKKIEELGRIELKASNEIEKKMNELNQRYMEAKNQDERYQITNYIEAIKWVTNVNKS